MYHSEVPSPEPSEYPAPTATFSTSGLPTSAPTVNALNDYEALSALYASIGDTMGNSFWGYGSNTKRNNWLQGDPCTNSWYGVSCRKGVVSSLSIDGRGATGTLPSEFGKLTGLTSAYLNYNSMTGTVPTEVGRLSNLESGFYLNSNQFTGSMPTELGLSLIHI